MVSVLGKWEKEELRATFTRMQLAHTEHQARGHSVWGEKMGDLTFSVEGTKSSTYKDKIRGTEWTPI
jgi:hypothetical protein